MLSLSQDSFSLYPNKILIWWDATWGKKTKIKLWVVWYLNLENFDDRILVLLKLNIIP